MYSIILLVVSRIVHMVYMVFVFLLLLLYYIIGNSSAPRLPTIPKTNKPPQHLSRQITTSPCLPRLPSTVCLPADNSVPTFTAQKSRATLYSSATTRTRRRWLEMNVKVGLEGPVAQLSLLPKYIVPNASPDVPPFLMKRSVKASALTLMTKNRWFRLTDM